MEPLIRVEDIHKIYNPGENEVRALDGVSLEIPITPAKTRCVPWTESLLRSGGANSRRSSDIPAPESPRL